MHIKTWVLVGHDDRGHSILGAWNYEPTEVEKEEAKVSRVVKDWNRHYLAYVVTEVKGER